MPDTTRIDLHLHSAASDGRLPPEALADLASHHRLTLVSLTDHDTLVSQAAFIAAAVRRGVGCVSGVELTTWHAGRETHLLAFGIDTAHAELLDTLAAVRQARTIDVHSLEHSVLHRPPGSSTPSVLTGGRLATADAIGLVHRAGGRVFLAHPLVGGQDLSAVAVLAAELKGLGLDGIEAFYAQHSHAERDALAGLAGELGLLVSGGSDLHDPATDPRPMGVDLPDAAWQQLRAELGGAVRGGDGPLPLRSRAGGLRRFLWHIVLPAVLAMGLFVGGLFGYLLPRVERALLDRKRETIRDLAASAATILDAAYRDEAAGRATRQQAQDAAAGTIGAMRYGRDAKDYFWLQDMTPRMVMHPYRPELNGQDVSEFRDPRGTRIFVEFADVVRRRGEGYVDYVWQFQDDRGRLSPKESYVKGFAPWGWVIGTGMYIDDVRQEIVAFEKGLIRGSLAIASLVSLLLLYLVRESLRLERQRGEAQQHLVETTRQYQSLVEASTEGAVLLVDGRCRYANPMVLKLLGRSLPEALLLHLDDLLPATDANAAARAAFAEPAGGPPLAIRAELAGASGEPIRCRLTLTPVTLGDHAAAVLQVRDAANPPIPTLPVAADFARQIARIAAADDPATVAALARGVEELAADEMARGVHPHRLTAELSAVCDAATARLIELAMAELPPPPRAFAFVSMGSQARQEQTLFTDQDNAILFADAPGEDDEAARAWFVDLGRRVCSGLADAGYALCRGGLMAQNPAWCLTLSQWKALFGQWIDRSEPKELLGLSIFFDLRPVYGQGSLVDDLRAATQAAVAASPTFLPHFAQHALQFKPPMRLFGHILGGPVIGEHGTRIDLKDATIPIVSFARLYAWKHAIALTGTLARLDALTDAGVLPRRTVDDLRIALDYLTRLRLEHHLAQAADGLPRDNAIDRHALTHIESALLREAFEQVDVVQQKIAVEFLGGQPVG